MTHKIEISSHFDYMTVSYTYCAEPHDAINPVYHFFKPKEVIKPFPHYDRAWRLECGGSLHLSENEIQGARLDLTGENLAWLRKEKLTDDYLVRILAESEKKRRTTRVDYAFNVHNAGSVRHTVNHWRSHNIKTTFTNAPKGWVDFGSRRGQTVYYGSQKSDKYVRVYDKASEMNLLKEAWLRVELQTRGDYAQAMIIDTMKRDALTAGRTHLVSCLDFPKLRWWQEMITGDTMEKTQIGRSLTNWQKWMDGQVFDSILKHVKNIEDGLFLEEWLAKVAIAVASAETQKSIQD